MKGFSKATLYRLDTSDHKEESAGGKKRREETFSASPNAAMSHLRVDANGACVLTPKDKRPVTATPCTADIDGDATEARGSIG